MELIIKKKSMIEGVSTWFIMFGAKVWNLLLLNQFFIDLKKKNQD
jgi:hypothetical protein